MLSNPDAIEMILKKQVIPLKKELSILINGLKQNKVIHATSALKNENKQNQNSSSFWSHWVIESDLSESEENGISYRNLVNLCLLLATDLSYHDILLEVIQQLNQNNITSKGIKHIINEILLFPKEKIPQNAILLLMQKMDEMNITTEVVLKSILEKDLISVVEQLLKKDYFQQIKPDEILNSIKSEKMLYLLDAKLNFSNVDLQIHKVSEEISLAYFNKFPQKLKSLFNCKVMVKVLDGENILAENIMEYAIFTKQFKLLEFLLKNIPTDTLSIESEKIFSLPAAKLLIESKINIKNSLQNPVIYEAQVALKLNKEKSFSYSQDISRLIYFDLKNLIDEVFSSLDNKNLSFENFGALYVYYSKKGDIEKLKRLTKIGANNNFYKKDFSDINKALGSPFSNFCKEEIALSLLNAFDKDIIDSIRDEDLNAILNPKVGLALLKKEKKVDKQKIQEWYDLSLVQGKNELSNELKLYLPNEDLHNWAFKPINLSKQGPSDASSQIKKIYGVGIDQDEYLQYQQKMVDLVLVAILNNNFSLSSIKIETEESNPIVTQPFHQANETPLRVDLSRLGDMRNWLANLSGSVNHEHFGVLREANISTFSTPLKGINERYLPFFDEFVYKKLPKYKNSKYLKIDDYVVGEGSILPQCTIIGFINNEPIELTRFSNDLQYVNDGTYSWVHTDPSQFPKIFQHCEGLIKEILALQLDPKNVYQQDMLCQKIGSLHWWLSHAAYYKRGAASVSEVICKALFEWHGYEVVRWEKMPDCQALISPSEIEYASEYKNLTKLAPLEKKELLPQTKSFITNKK